MLGRSGARTRSPRTLTAVLASGAVALVVATGGLLVETAPAARADSACTPPSVPDGQGGCTLPVGASSSATSGGGGGGGGGGGALPCSWSGNPIPCSAPDGYHGNWDSDVDCWVSLANPQPPASDPSWNGHQPGDGVIWEMDCPRFMPQDWTQFVRVTYQWFADPPAGPAPKTLALEALAELTLNPPDIQMAPKKGATAVLGLPVWFWSTDTPTTWGPESQTVTDQGLSVTVTARVQDIVWQTGDGESVTCASPGTPYEQSYGDASSPTCGHTYAQPSGGQPGGAYQVTATSYWVASWTASDGQTGNLTDQTASSTTLKVGEVQVLNQ